MKFFLHFKSVFCPDLIEIQDASCSKFHLYLKYRCWSKNDWNIVIKTFCKFIQGTSDNISVILGQQQYLQTI